MTFGFPWFLLGALGAAIPVLIHLYGQRRARRVDFPSLMLLRRAERERSSLVRLRQVLLMLLRALAILCLALALARPVLTGLRLPWVAGTPVVLLLDDSLSMGAKGPGASAIERARQAATGLRQGLPPGQSYVLAPLSQGVSDLQTTDSRGLGDALGKCQATYQVVDLPAALGSIAAQATSPDLRQARWVLLTDLQASAWRSSFQPPPWLRDLLVVDCGTDGPNAALTGLQPGDVPALVGRPLQLRATVEAQPAGATASLPVRVTINQGALPSATCRLVRGRGEALFEWTPSKPGLLRIRASIPGDRLAEDNEAFLVVEVRKQLRVVLLGSGAATRWVRLALSPTLRAPIQTRTGPGDLSPALGGQDPFAQDAVVLLDAPEAGHEGDLEAFVESGGGLLIFAPTLPSPDLRVLLQLDGEELAPAPVPAAPVRIGSFDSFRPPLEAFANAAAGDLREPVFRRYCRITIPPDSRWRVLASFTDQTPALIAGSVGRGRVLIANFAPDTKSSDLTSLPVFVPLMHRLLSYVARSYHLETTRFLPGQTVSAQAIAGGAPGDAGAAPSLRPERPGIYELRWKAAGNRESVEHFAVNVDPLESDLRRLSPQEVQRRLQPVKVRVCGPDQIASSLPASAVPLATPLWVLGLVLLTVELWLLRRAPTPRPPTTQV
jgi:hypothetical protein